jgi:hypothetical protein
MGDGRRARFRVYRIGDNLCGALIAEGGAEVYRSRPVQSGPDAVGRLEGRAEAHASARGLRIDWLEWTYYRMNNKAGGGV